MAKKTRVTQIAGTASVTGKLLAGRLEHPAAGERAEDGAGLERHHEQAGRAPGRRRGVAGAAPAVEDQRDLERQPDHVEALEGEGDQVAGEVAAMATMPQLARAVTAVDASRMRLWPNMSPSLASTGTTSAETSSWAASVQL